MGLADFLGQLMASSGISSRRERPGHCNFTVLLPREHILRSAGVFSK